MNPNRKSILALSACLVTALACSLPTTPATPTSGSDGAGATPTTDTAAGTPTVLATGTAGLTGTPTVPVVTVSLDTNCRSGPSKDYDNLGTLLADQEAEVIAKSTETGYWIIKLGSVTCWLWGQYATVSGNTANLPEWPIPATPTPAATATPELPRPPKNLDVTKICIPVNPPPLFQYTGTFTWQDQSTNETGFNVYWQGGHITTTGPNVTSFPVPPQVFPPGVPITMAVEAVNDEGVSAQKQIVFTCP